MKLHEISERDILKLVVGTLVSIMIITAIVVLIIKGPA
jgi:hypothetical protein